MRYKLTYDGMWHLDIPKTRQYDNGKIEVVARNSMGEARVETVLTVKPRGDDYRGVLKNSPRRELFIQNSILKWMHLFTIMLNNFVHQIVLLNHTIFNIFYFFIFNHKSKIVYF